MFVANDSSSRVESFEIILNVSKVNKYIKYSEETMEEEIDKIFDPEA